MPGYPCCCREGCTQEFTCTSAFLASSPQALSMTVVGAPFPWNVFNGTWNIYQYVPNTPSTPYCNVNASWIGELRYWGSSDGGDTACTQQVSLPGFPAPGTFNCGHAFVEAIGCHLIFNNFEGGWIRAIVGFSSDMYVVSVSWTGPLVYADPPWEPPYTNVWAPLDGLVLDEALLGGFSPQYEQTYPPGGYAVLSVP